MVIRKTRMIGNVVRAMKVSGSRWMVYKLKDEERPDFCGNRIPLQYMYGRKQTYKYVKDLDPDPMEDRYEA